MCIFKSSIVGAQYMVCKMCTVVFLDPGCKSAAGVDDDNISDPLVPSPAPRVRSTKPGVTAKSKFEVHVQIDSANHILNRARWGP